MAVRDDWPQGLCVPSRPQPRDGLHADAESRYDQIGAYSWGRAGALTPRDGVVHESLKWWVGASRPESSGVTNGRSSLSAELPL